MDRRRFISTELPPIFYWTFGGVGLLLLGIAALLFSRDRQKMEHYAITSGVVIDNNYRGGHTVVEYEWMGEKRTYSSNTSSRPPAHESGERVELLVNPSNPSDVMINNFLERFLAIAILSGLGTVFLGFTLLFYHLSDRG